MQRKTLVLVWVLSIMFPFAADRENQRATTRMAPAAASTKKKYLKLCYQCVINNFFTLLLIPLAGAVAAKLSRLGVEGMIGVWESLKLDPVYILCSGFSIVIASTVYLLSKPRSVYLVDFGCFKPPITFRVPFATFMEHAHLLQRYSPDGVDFMMKILERSGLGEETSLPPAMHYIPPKPTMEKAREEAELVMFSAIDNLMRKTGLRPREIDILVVNCSLFSPTPSLSAMIVNKYKLRSNIKSFNLSGMGCSAGVISIDLAKDLLQAHPNSCALVVSTEIITLNNYEGSDRTMLLPNCIFRMGAAAMLLSNKARDRRRAKYKLLHVVRTHKGADDSSYKCVFQQEDSEGQVGVHLSRDLMVTAGRALKSSIVTIGPLALPPSEKLLFALSLIGRNIINPNWRLYTPDFKQAFDHFCIHAGGRAVIDELQKSLELSPEHVEASRMSLYRFGNTSSSSIWYELAYIEAKGRMKKGNKVWQIAFGSGFKCNSAVWKCNRTIKTPVDGPWKDCIDKFPVSIPEVVN